MDVAASIQAVTEEMVLRLTFGFPPFPREITVGALFATLPN
jgi:hypothetical protein